MKDTLYYLAVDIGASSGRHVLGWIKDGVLQLEEVYRFPNGVVRDGGTLCWDVENLKKHVIAGIAKCREIGKIPTYMGIDTWGVDFVLLDEADEIIGKTVAYRDSRTQGMDEKVSAYISEADLYGRTGIQKNSFNTIYQLMAIKESTPDDLARAKTLLMMPDYLNFVLTGKKAVEYTDASTTGLLDVSSGDWDRELLEILGYPTDIFMQPTMPGTVLGGLRAELAASLGFDVTVVLPASHDTGSAVLALPVVGEADSLAYLSSGTWSLMGVERMEPDTSARSHAANFTHEGGYDKRYRYLKNIMGLWMIQSVKKECNDEYDFPTLSRMAREVGEVAWRVNVNDDAFLAPDSMIDAVKAAVGKDLTLPEVLAVIYLSLAETYRNTLDELERCTGKKIDTLYIIGGGSRDTYLNELTARISGRTVCTGLVEATSTGNILCQMLGSGMLSCLQEARELCAKSFAVAKV
ncbi:MAG: rhamnulokinase [Clostridia bacterium]|nr:rhamnulokinase [Clostridia bacterium]